MKRPDRTKEIIWAPWRIDYILSEQDEDCFFCDAFEAVEDNWKDHFLLTRDNQSGILLNKFPYNNGHLLVAPVDHVRDLSDLRTETKLSIMTKIERMIELIRNRMDAEGFNVGLNLGEVAGAGFPDHLHFHVVPRWSGDRNFMPVVAETNVIPQSLDELYDLLREGLQEQN